MIEEERAANGVTEDEPKYKLGKHELTDSQFLQLLFKTRASRLERDFQIRFQGLTVRIAATIRRESKRRGVPEDEINEEIDEARVANGVLQPARILPEPKYKLGRYKITDAEFLEAFATHNNAAIAEQFQATDAQVSQRRHKTVQCVSKRHDVLETDVVLEMYNARAANRVMTSGTATASSSTGVPSTRSVEKDDTTAGASDSDDTEVSNANNIAHSLSSSAEYQDVNMDVPDKVDFGSYEDDHFDFQEPADPPLSPTDDDGVQDVGINMPLEVDCGSDEDGDLDFIEACRLTLPGHGSGSMQRDEPCEFALSPADEGSSWTEDDMQTDEPCELALSPVHGEFPWTEQDELDLALARAIGEVAHEMGFQMEID